MSPAGLASCRPLWPTGSPHSCVAPTSVTKSILNPPIPRTVRFAEAPVKGMSVLKYDPDGMAAQSYRDLAKEVLAHGKR